MNLLQQIHECDENELDSVIEEAIKKCNEKANKVDKLGFLQNGGSNNVFKGFIPLNTKIKYANLSIEDYSMQTTDFFYDFAKFIRQYKITSKASLIFNLEYFINSYFGYPGKTSREAIFNEIAWKTTTTDEEYFNALEKNKIGDLKGKGAAQCTERSALAEQILSIFDIESYYTMGCIDLENRQEAHCFNIVKRKNDYAILDYSMPVCSYNQDGSIKAYYPFVGELTNDEFLEFLNSGVIKTFNEYCYKNGNQKENLSKTRSYVVGQYKIEKEDIKSNVK